MKRSLIHYLNIGIGLGILSYLMGDLEELIYPDDDYDDYNDLEINNNKLIINLKYMQDPKIINQKR